MIHIYLVYSYFYHSIGNKCIIVKHYFSVQNEQIEFCLLTIHFQYTLFCLLAVRHVRYPLKPYILTYTKTVSSVNMIDTTKNTLFLSINTLRIKITPISISSVEIKCDRLKTINNTPTKKATLPKINLNLLFIILI